MERKMFRKMFAEISVDEERSAVCGMGDMDYLITFITPLQRNGIYLNDARIIDDDCEICDESDRYERYLRYLAEFIMNADDMTGYASPISFEEYKREELNNG